MTHARHIWSMLVTLAACSGDTSNQPDAQSEFIDLYVEDGFEPCAGALPAYDRFVTRVFERWDGQVPPDWRANLHMYHPEGSFPDGTPCPNWSAGCASNMGVWTSGGRNVYHELVHVITRPHPVPFFREGIAEAWGGGQIIKRFATTESQFSEFLFITSSREFWEPDALKYAYAAVFTNFLLREYGIASYRQFYGNARHSDMPEAIQEMFIDAFGAPLDEVVAVASSQLGCIDPLWFCDDAEPTELPIELHEPLDCADPATAGFSSGALAVEPPYRLFRIELAELTRLELTVSNASIEITKCGDCNANILWLPQERTKDEMLIIPFDTPAGSLTVLVTASSEDSFYFDLRRVP